jgi:hypothetical protein
MWHHMFEALPAGRPLLGLCWRGDADGIGTTEWQLGGASTVENNATLRHNSRDI